jgi:ATP-dependent RNA circularization protein (DNA/RNA ligase family)
MNEYHKIQSVFKRDAKTHKFIDGDFSIPEFEYLKNNKWVWTEKVDGTNIRVFWDKDLKQVKFGGRTDSASMPMFLLDRLEKVFTLQKLFTAYPEKSMTLYGEGYGHKIQKGGEQYISNDVGFVLFDVSIGDLYLERKNVEGIGAALDLKVVPIVGTGSLLEAIEIIKLKSLLSVWGDFLAEGLVLRPEVELKTRLGDRIITKIKHKDFA